MTKKTPPKAVKKKTTPPKAKAPKAVVVHTRETRKPRIVKTKPAVVVKAPAPVPVAIVEQSAGIDPDSGLSYAELENLMQLVPSRVNVYAEKHCSKPTLTQQQWDAVFQDTLAAAPYEAPSPRVPTWLKVVGGIVLAAVAGVVWYVVQT